MTTPVHALNSGPDPSAPVSAISWQGNPLRPRPLPDEVRQEFEHNLANARAELQHQPDAPQGQIWVGRRLAYLGRFNEAIDVYTRALVQQPNHAALYRHRGHRYLTTRDLDRARADLARAAQLVEGTPDEVEPDGLPNAQNQPRSTLHTNIYYHLGLAHYLAGDFAAAAQAYRTCLARSTNDDMLVATTHWLYMALRRQGQHAAADQTLSRISPQMDVIENNAYHRLLLMYAGQIPADDLQERQDGSDSPQNPALAYGLANYHLVSGRADRAYALMGQIVKNMRWDAFGTMAAEADLARRNPLPRVSVDVTAPFALDTQLAAWVEAWNRYDLPLVDDLFLTDARPTYFSSEKRGLIRGIDAIREHHRGFGFVAGGKHAQNSLWVDGLHHESYGETVIVTGTWYFGLNPPPAGEPPQRGPFTFVYVQTPVGYRIAHAHFAND